MMQKCCFNCAYCSESYPSFIDSCDLDGENIPDVYTQACEKFEAVCLEDALMSRSTGEEVLSETCPNCGAKMDAKEIDHVRNN